MPGKRIRPYVDYQGLNEPTTDSPREGKKQELTKRLREDEIQTISIPPPPRGKGLIEICCVGLNPEEAMLEAIITINSTPLLPEGREEGKKMQVSFSVIVDGGMPIPCGSTTINVFRPDSMITRNYAVRKLLSPNCAAQIFAATPQMGPRLVDCVALIPGVDISSLRAPIPFPQRSHWGRWKLLRRQPETDDFAGRAFPVHAAALKNGQVLFFAGANNDDFAIFDPNTDSIQMALPGSHMIETWLEFEDEIQITRIEDGNEEDATKEAFQLPEDTATTEFRFNQQAIALSHGMFCSGHTLLSDGSLIVIGGSVPQRVGPDHYHHDHPLGPKEVSLYQTDTATWESITPLRHGRWYPTTVIMGDGNVFVMEGHPDSDDPLLSFGDDFNKELTRRHTNNDREIYLAQTRSWQYEATANASMVGIGSFGEYPRLHLLPDGNILCTSKIFILPRQETIDIKNNKLVRTVTKAQEFSNGITAVYETAKKLWKKVFEFPNTNMIGANITSASILLPLVYPAYRPEVLIFDNWTNDYFRFSPDSPTPSWTSVGNRPLSGSRIHGSGVILPDGTVFFVGGNLQEGIDGGDPTPQLKTEIFDPFDDNGVWSEGAPLSEGRGYHSVALLMYDGRVFVGGGEPRTKSFDDFEIYTPDCLLRGPRPEFNISREHVSYGQTLSIRLAGDWKFKHIHPHRVALIRCSSATHAFNIDQRYVNLQPRKKLRRLSRFDTNDGVGYFVDEDPIKRLELITDQPFDLPNDEDGEFDVVIPENRNLLPPGYYFLFLLSKIGFGMSGAASKARIIRIS